METRRLTASEKEALLRMNVALQILNHEPERLKDRIGLIPGGKRDTAMMSAKITRLLEMFRDTIPPEQLPIYERALRMSQYWVGVRKPGNSAGTRDDREFGMWISYDVLNTLLSGLRDHCDLCNLEKAQRKSCPLKKALDIIPNDVKEREDGDCQYFVILD